MLDYIVVGLGLSGVAVCSHLEKKGRTFKAITDGQRMASTVAGGVYNPVVLKRLTPTWKGAAFLDYALPYYRKLQEQLDIDVLQENCILRKFTSVEEQNNWFIASDQPNLNRFLSSRLQSNNNSAIVAPHGLGRVEETGRVDVPKLIAAYAAYLKRKERLLEEEVDFEALEVHKQGVRYKKTEAKKLVLAMGHRALESPWFNYLPIQGNKGEVLVIKAPDLKLEAILKAADFVIPLGNHLYKAGATYNTSDLSFEPTEAARSRLIRNLERAINCSYVVMKHEVGIRPTVPDRRPLVGLHPEYSNLGILNGMGSRGVLLAPMMAISLIDHMENGTALEPETDIKRYLEYYHDA